MAGDSGSDLGVMQGRLLPKYLGRYQAHPVGYWQQEFPIAAELGLTCIEFILDFDDAEENPLLTAEGPEEIQRVVDDSGVEVRTVCADYFMKEALHHPDETAALRSQSILRRLLQTGQTLGLTDIVIPCVDESSMDPDATERLVRRLRPLLDLAEEAQTNLCLETDLAPQPFAELLDRCGSRRVTANYDTGNSAALGYDPLQELACYGDRISDIHLKDRSLNGGSMLLGTGDAQFEGFFEGLKAVDFTGPFILQAYRDDEGVEVFRSQLAWVRSSFLS
jgi:L-ribulose-5-phosphate 3-epimerase